MSNQNNEIASLPDDIVKKEELSDRELRDHTHTGWDKTLKIQYASLEGTPTLIATHSDLTGLSADDHTQYFLASGSRAITSSAGGAGFKNEDDMASNSAVAMASQKSIKSYVDNNTSNLIIATSTEVSSSSTANLHILCSTTIPGYTLDDFDAIHFRGVIDPMNMNTNGTLSIYFQFAGSTGVTLTVPSTAMTNGGGILEADLFSRGVTNTQAMIASVFTSGTGASIDHPQIYLVGRGNLNRDGRYDKPFTIKTQAQFTGPLSGSFTLRSYTITKLKGNY